MSSRSRSMRSSSGRGSSTRIRERAGGDGGGAGEPGERAFAHAVLEVAVLRAEPDLALARLAAGDAQAHRAVRRVHDEAGALVDLPQPQLLEALLNHQVARHDDAPPALHRRRLRAVRERLLQHERAQRQLLLGGGAGADERPI